MADRSPRHAADLEARLEALGSELEYPRADRVAPAVAARVASTRVPRFALALPASRRRRRAVLLLAAAALLAAIAAATNLSIGALTIRESASPAPAPPTDEPAALGRPTTLDAAGRALGAPPALPPALGAPDAVFLDRVSSTDVVVVLAWRQDRGLPQIDGIPWGAVLLELRGDSALATKTLFPSSPGGIDRVEVGSEPGYWLTGRHELDIATQAGPRRFLVTGNVLLWVRGNLTLRLETGLPETAAVSIAEGMSQAAPT